jgi:hypothetical protein
MDHIRVLKRAFEMTWRYRALWVFGILVALTTSQGGGGGGNAGRPPYSGDTDFSSLPGRFAIPDIPPQIVGTLIAIGLGLVCMAIIVAILRVVVRYVATTALIRMVDDCALTGEKQSVRWGIRQGWSRSAWRLFLIDLLIGIPVAVAFILLFLLALAPLLLWATGDETAGIAGTLATVVMVMSLILLLIVVSVVLSLLTHFFRRACALEAVGVVEAIRQGTGVVRRHLKDVGVMWLIMFGLSIAWLFAIIPLMIALVLLGLAAGGLPALLVGGLVSLTFEGAVPWILAALVGLPIFIVAIAIPVLFLGGLVEVFRSSVWTLTYRELRGLEQPEPEPAALPQADAPDLGVAPVG